MWRNVARSPLNLQTMTHHRQCCMQQRVLSQAPPPPGRHHMQDSCGLSNHTVLDNIHSFTVISWTPEPIRPTGFLSALTVCSCNRGHSRGGNAGRDLVRRPLALLTGAVGQWVQYIRAVICALCPRRLASNGSSSADAGGKRGFVLTSLMHSRTSSSPAVSAER